MSYLFKPESTANTNRLAHSLSKSHVQMECARFSYLEKSNIFVIADYEDEISQIKDQIYSPVLEKILRKMSKLRQMKADDNIRNLLQSKFDRETLMAVLQLERNDLDQILNNCNYSEEFIRTANDLQILDAISECYEEYKVLNRD